MNRIISKKSIAKHLTDSGFKRIYKNYDIPASEADLKEICGSEIEIEFLTDKVARKDNDKNLTISGVIAQPLSYLNLNLNQAIQFNTFSGQEGYVVSSGAWDFHKGLTFLRRVDSSKKYKDLNGIWYVLTQLGKIS